jgi:hypothetical protein
MSEACSIIENLFIPPRGILVKKIYPCLALIALSACSKLNDMHDATMAMSATTAKMGATTEGMNGVMGEIFDSGRQGAALDLRTKQWENLINSSKLEDKGTFAGLYFLAFEFQLWANIGHDSRAGERERLEADAVKEFSRRLLGITHWAPEELDPFAGKNPLKFGNVENEKASFNAVAASLEENNRKQEMTAADANTQALSMLNLITQGLRAGKEIREGKATLADFPEYVDLVLQREELMTRLLKARYQVLGLAVLGQLTPLTRNLTEGFKYKYLGRKWDINFNQLSESLVNLATFRIQQANEARDVLQELGIEVTLDPSIKDIFSRATVKNFAGTQGALVADPSSSAAHDQESLIGVLKNYTQGK